MAAMDSNAFTIPFQFTQRMRREIYPAIDPKSSHNSAAGKVVLVTGASGGIGGEIARAWAQAGAKGIILAGRNASLLKEPAKAIEAIDRSVGVLTATVDITSETEVKALFNKAAAQFGKVDVVAHAAGSMGAGPVGDLTPSEWFKDYEINVKGTYILVHYFLQAFGGEGTFLNLVSLGASFTNPGISSYSGSKLAVIKLGEYLDAEKPSLRIFHIHPGIVGVTDTKRGMVVDILTPFAKDKGIQTGGLSLYLSTPRADYLKGSFLSVNWDVDEMEKHKQEIIDKKLLRLGFLGAQLGPEGHPWSA